jgi:hypothetical protein
LEIADKINLVKDGKIIPISGVHDLITLGYLSEQSIVIQ